MSKVSFNSNIKQPVFRTSEDFGSIIALVRENLTGIKAYRIEFIMLSTVHLLNTTVFLDIPCLSSYP